MRDCLRLEYFIIFKPWLTPWLAEHEKDRIERMEALISNFSTPLDSDGTILSGAYYRVLEDTDLDFLLESTTGPLLIESISVMAPEDDDPTGISRLKADEADADIYDLRGRKVDSTNLLKGVYIKNGKKIVVK